MKKALTTRGLARLQAQRLRFMAEHTIEVTVSGRVIWRGTLAQAQGIALMNGGTLSLSETKIALGVNQ